MFKPKGRHVRQSQVEKFTRYSIRKVSFGAASVAVATGLFFLGGGSVQAAEQVTNSEPTEVQNPQNVNEKSSEPSREVTGQASATAKEPDGQNNTSAKESSPVNETSAVETPEVVAEKVAINTASLEDLVAKVEGRLSQLTEGKKTKSVIDDAKNLVNKAKELLNDDTKTQVKVDSLSKQLSSSLVILNSIKSETTEEKETKNQDPRNGKAIPGKGESGFRADTFIVNESNTTTVPDTTTTGTDKFTFVAIPENDSRRNNKVIAIASGQAGDIEVKGTGNAPTDLEIEMYSSQRTGQAENPVAMSTVNGQPVTSPGRMDYPLSKEQVQKLQEEAKLWRNKLKPDGNSISNNPATVFGSSGAYEFLATEIYKMGYEQGVDRAYIPNISNRFAVTDKAKEAGWKIKSISPTNLPSGLIYDKESDSIQGRVVSNVQNGVQDLRFTVEAENEKTHQIVSMEFRNLRSGWIAWQDSKPPKLEVSDDAYETQVGKNVNIDIAYKDDAGSNFSGSRRQVNYKLASGKVVAIPNQNFRQAISGLAGYATTKQAGELDGTKTSIPGISYSLSQDGTPVETDENGDQSIYGKAKLSGTATTAGIYTVSVFAKDYNTTKKSDSTWIHSGHEVQKYITVVVKPTITVKNVHAYATTIPVTISDGASTAEVKLPNGKITKLEVRDGQWVVASGTTNEKAVQGTALGQVGSEINIPVSEEDTKDASTDTIVAKAITENVKATLLRNELSLTDNNGVHKARLDETTGHWELDKNYREVKESTPNGGYKLTKRQVFTEVQTDGTINYYIYSYTRTYNANDEIESVDEVRRDKTVVPRLNTATQEGNAVVVEYNPVTQTWTSSDNSKVTATKEGNFWNIRTESGFTGLVKGSIAESDDKASILNNAPTASSTSYTTVKGATVDLVKQASAAVTIKDTEDDSTTSPKKETTITKVTVTAPSGQQSEYTDLEQAKAHLLSEVGTYTVKVEVKDSNGNIVTADTETDTGTNKGADTAVNSTTYTITVKDQPTNKLYTVEGDTVTNDQLKEKVVPTEVDGFTATKNDIADIPTTAKKAGQTLEVPATVTYTKGTETISVATKVDVVVLPKVEPTGVTVLKDSTNLEETVKAKAVEAATAVPTDKLPAGVTVSVKEVKQGTVPATSTTGVQNPATVVIEYKDANNNVVATKEVTVPVTVVGSTASDIVVFEGEKPTAEQAKAAVTPGTDGTKGEPTTLPETTGKAGATDVKVDVPVTYDNGKLTETVSVPVTVLPKATGEVEVPKGSTVDKVKEVAKAKAKTLTESADFTGKLPAGATVTVGDITEAVAETLTNEKGTNKGVVNVPATYTVDGKTYTTTIPVTINVLGSEPKTVYTVEGTKPDASKVKDAVTPGTGGTVNAPTEAGLPETTGKVGAKDVTVPTTVTYSTGDETVNVPVEVLPKATPEKVITLKDTTSDSLKTAVKEKAQAALGKLALPSGVTAELDPNQDYTVPATTSNGDKDNVPVKVQYKDSTGTVVAEDTISVPVTVVSSTPSKIVVFEGETPTAEQAKAAVTPGTDGTKGEPTTLPETTGKAGATDITVDVPVTYDNGKLTETVKVPVTVLPKPEADEILVPKNGDKEKAKEKVLAQAEKAIADGTFTGKLPQGAKVEIDKTAPVTVPDLTDDTEVDVTVKYTVDGEEKTTTVKVPVTVVESVPQIVPVDENNKQPDPEKSIDKTDYPEGSTFRYKTPDGQTSPIDVTTTGDKNVVVEVLDPQGNTIVEVPATVRVVGSTPQFVVADPAKKQPEAKDSVTPGDYPDGTTFEYKTPVDTTTPGEKDVTVVAKLNGQPIAEVPAKVVVVDPKTQYVVADPSKPQPDASKSIDPEQYPDGTTFEYKTPVDTTTTGEKDVVVVAKNGEDKLVEVPTKVKVVQGNPQIVPVDEGKKQPSPEDSIDPNDYPDDATFEYKEEVDTSTPGDKKVTVVVKQGDKVLVEVPATVRVVGSTPQIVVADPAKKQPEAKDSVTPGEYPDGTTFEYKTPVDTTTAGEKDVTVVAKLNGQPIAEVPAKVVVVDPKTQYVVADPSKPQPDASKSIDPEQYPDGTTFEYKTPVDTTTTGEKDVVVVAKNGEDKLVEVPTKVKVVQGNPQIVPVDEGKKQPSPEDSIDPNDYPDDATFEYKEEVDTSTPGDKKVTVVVKQGDKVLVEVPATVRVVGSTPQFVVADPTKKQPEAKDSVTPGDYPEGTTFEYKTPVDTTTPGEKDVTVVAKLNGQPIAEVPAKVVVVDPKTQYVVADPSKPQPDASKSIDPEQYPDGTTFEYKTPVDTTTTGEKDVVVVAKNGEDKLVEVPTKVKVVQGNPQIVPVDEGKKQPSPEDSIDPNDYPDDATFEYKEEVDTSTPGDKKVTVVVKQGDKVLVEVPSTVRVVESYPKYVPVDPAKKQPDPKENINPNDFPTGTTFEYKDNTPVDTTTPGEKPVTVVAKLNGQPITEIPAKIVVVEPKTQYVPVNAEGDKKPKPQDSITPDDYPEGSTFEYKTPEGQTTPYDGTTPGEKDVTVVVKDPDGDTIVEVPAKIKVVQGKEQLTPVNAEDKDKPKAEDSIIPSDYPEGSTFEYKVPEGQTTPYDGTTPGDKPVTVVVKDKDGKVLVEVPATIKVVETKPTPIETPVTNTPLTEDDYTKGMKIPEGATVKVGDLPDLTTPGEKTPVKVTITLPNGKSYTVDVPVTVTPVKEIETPVTTTPLTPEDYTKGIKIPEGGKVTNVANIPDLTTPGKKDPVKVTIELPNGKVITVDVPVTVTPVKEIETPVTTTPLTPEDYTKGIKIPEGGKVTNVANIPDLTTPGKKDPVKVTIELPNGKVITVDVPVNVTPVKEIETPVTTTPLTPDDYTKGITIPEGGKVTKVENIPDLTTPGKKDPVKVTIELPNGKVITVDVPVNVTPVKEIETPVTTTPLTPDDYTKGITIPEGGKVTKVENIPDLTTPGKKDPVKVTIELPNGKVITVDVPVTVTPVTPIETPVTKDKLTPEDILKQIKVPEGATVKVGDLPDLTTPGKKDPVKVTITLPNGKVVTVEIPVTVTPIEDIVKKEGDPITNEDVEKHIPKGVKVISIGDKPTTAIPGERPSIPVVIELPNGIRVTVNIPVIVTPKVTPVVVSVGTPVTPEDVQKHIELPNGWKVTKVGEIPTTSTPGTKPVVPVEIELPDGRKITVDVPVIVTPTVRQIVVPQGTPITPDDVKGHIDLPKEPGWEIVEVGEIPTTIPAGVKPSVKVKIKVPTGEIVEVEVPIIVTPKVTPIVVEVGTPITKEDVIKKVGLPEGWEIVEVGEIPTTETPGTKPVVKVKVKLPDGRIITVEVPVTVTPKSQNGDSTIQIVTEYLDENGNRITSDKEGKHNPIELEGYEFSHSTTDAKGNTLHHYKKVTNPINQEQPSSNDKKELPNTGTEDKAGLASLGLLGMLGAFGLVARKKKED